MTKGKNINTSRILQKALQIEGLGSQVYQGATI